MFHQPRHGLLSLIVVLALAAAASPTPPPARPDAQLDIVVGPDGRPVGPVDKTIYTTVAADSVAADLDPKVPLFVPTKDWQDILPGQGVPAGLHYRMNLETGKKEARLMPGGYDPAQDDTVPTKRAKPRVKKLTIEEQELERAELIERVMRSLPMPPAELDSVNRTVSPEKWKEVLNILWEKRQKMIHHASSQIHNSATAMQNATRDLLGNISTAEEKVGILLAVNALVRQIDNANDFKTVGGLAVTTGLLDDQSRDVRRNAAWVIGTASRNVATVQAAALDLGVVNKLVQNLKIEDDVGTTKKLVLALNAVVQGLDAAEAKLVEIGGADVLNDLARDAVNGWRGAAVVEPADLCALQSKILTTATDLPALCGAGVVDVLLAPDCNTNIHREVKLLAFQSLSASCPALAARKAEWLTLLRLWLEEWGGAEAGSFENDLAGMAGRMLSL
jgi:hypothetical protein